jgi:hypothetical protein
MKILLACLLCPILVASQCLAIDGGPFNGGGGQISVTGTYAGVLVPVPTVFSPGPPPVMMTDNSLALFTLSIPKVGLATGVTAVFRNGIAYFGIVTGSADPDSGKLTGVINAVFLQLFSTSTSGSGIITSEYDANGGFDHARIVANTNTTSTAAARIRGQASLTYTNFRNDGQPPDPRGDSGGPIKYKIRGFKQAEAGG